jgi:hypothetical protein
MPDFIRVETYLGQPVSAYGVRLLPFARSTSLRLPFFDLGLVWNRPVSILAISADGQEQVLPVRDPTRQIIWALYGGIAALAGLILWTTFVQRGTNERRRNN